MYMYLCRLMPVAHLLLSIAKAAHVGPGAVCEACEAWLEDRGRPRGLRGGEGMGLGRDLVPKTHTRNRNFRIYLVKLKYIYIYIQ